jgi:hypothetical protein
MYSLVKALGTRAAVSQEALPFATAFVIAELLYKFKSFALECAAFLATWYILSWIQARLMKSR